MRRPHFPAVIAALAPALAAHAGDLDPPPGPVDSTMKTIEEAEPRIPIGPDTTPGDADSVYRIIESGSYYLTEHLMGEPGKHGIQIDPPVGGELCTIDLNGFSLLGVPGSLDGISTSGRCNVRNGAADDWGGNGMAIGEGTIENVTAISNGAIGIRAAWGNLILNCRAELNGSHGISCGDVSRIHACVAKGNTGRGIQLDGAGSISECVLYNNDGGGIDAAIAIIDRNYFFSNSGPSIEDRGGSTITGNTIVSGGVGVLCTGDRSRIESNSVSNCITGFDIDGTGNIVIRNTDSGSTTSFDLAAGNTHGPIVSASGVGDLAAVTNAGHPWANFEH